MAAASHSILVLMYHSLSERLGPTCIPPELFRRQMDALDDYDYRVASTEDCAAWLRGERELPHPCAVLTFDDGFDDFVDVGFPLLSERRWPATVFLPAARLEGVADWDGAAGSGAGRLMSWSGARRLAGAGIALGAHGMSHADLTRIPLDDAREEIIASKSIIEERTGQPVAAFAPPYGRIGPAIHEVVRGHYSVSFGTRCAPARRDGDPYDVPRIEMHYFRNVRRWRAYLQGGARTYFAVRRTLRAVRGLAARA